MPLGHESFEALLDARELLSCSQAHKLIAIVDAYTRDQALALGLEKAFAVIAYAAATPAHEVPQLVVATGINGTPLEKLSANDTVEVRAPVEQVTHVFAKRTRKG